MQKANSKIKILKKFNLCTLHGFTNKFNLYYRDNKQFAKYKLTKNIQLLKILYNFKKKNLKFYEFNILNFISIIKSIKLRIDSVLLESSLFKTLNDIRQNISHKHVLINNKIIINCRYSVKDKDILHTLNFINSIFIENIIYNYISKNLKTYSIHSKIFKTFKRRKKYSKNIIIYNNFIILNNIICYKNLKIRVNMGGDVFSLVDSSKVNFV